MTWPAKFGTGVVVLAALAAGHAVNTALPADRTDVRAFVHSAHIGELVRMTYADVSVDKVRAARGVDTPRGRVGTTGRWLIVDLVVVARARPLTMPGIVLEDAAERSFGTDPRSGYLWADAPTGVPWRVQVPFEVPEDALRGATVVFSRDGRDDRRGDVARISLDIDSGHAAELWNSQTTIELHEPATEP